MAVTRTGRLFSRTRTGVGFAGLLLLWVSVARAQLPTGAISGRVLDSSGAVLPGAGVSATSRETGRVQTTETSASGYYKIVLPVGIYDIKVGAASFRPEIRQNLKLEVAQEAVLNFTLSVGSVQEAVTVTAEVPLVETTSGSLGGLVNEQRIADLPLNGRNFNDLVLLQTGIAENEGASSTSAANRGLAFSSNGAPIRSNYMMLDGATLNGTTGVTGGSVAGSMLGVEGIREFRVITHAFPAEYGMTMGSQMTVVSKNGTNEFHGSVFEFLRNSALDARDFFDRKLKPTNPRIPAFRRNNLGGAFGGPIRKDKTFFFLTYEGVRESMGRSVVLATPTAEARQDGFLVPRIAENVKPYLNLFPLPTEPLPTDPTGRSGVGRFTFIHTQPTREDFGQGRFDQTFSERDSAFLRYTIVDSERIEGMRFPGFTVPGVSRGQYATLADNHTFSPTVLNLLRLSYSRTYRLDGATYANADSSLSFIPGQPLGTINAGSGIPAMGAGNTNPTSESQDILTLGNDVFWSRGSHSVKFGTLLNRFRLFKNSPGGARGTYTFSNLMQFLLGNPREFTAAIPRAIPMGTFRWNTFGFYVQDDWRVVPNLTLNLGIRYEFTSTINEVTGLGATLKNAIRDDEFTVTPEPWLNPSLRNFGPRMGFAWDVLGNASTSVRGGFALLYDISTANSIITTAMSNHAPFAGDVFIETNLTFPRTVIPPGARGNTVAAWDYHMQQPHMLHYNVSVERQLPGNAVLSVGYAGTRGLNLYQRKEGNPSPPSGKVDGRDFWTGDEPRPNLNFGFIELKTAAGDSWYNSLQLRLEKRLSHGLQFQSSYTWSKVLDNTQGQVGGETGPGGILGVDPHHPSTDKGPADFNTPHSWAFNALYQLPSPGLRGVGRVLEGWRMGTILAIRSGLPFTPLLSGNRSRSKVGLGDGADAVRDRPDLAPGRKPSDIILGGPDRYFDPTAYTVQPAGFLGTSGRGTLQGPLRASWDFSLTKQIPLGFLRESGGLEFRAEMFNLLNHANFYPPVTGARVYTADQTRASMTPLATAGQIDRTLGSARQIQFGLKLIF